MSLSRSFTTKQTIGISVLGTVFITYPNVMWMPWYITSADSGSETQFCATFLFRCAFFFVLFFAQIRLNDSLLGAHGFMKRFGKNLGFTIAAGVLFIAISYLVPLLGIQSATVGKHLTFQFLVVSLLCTFIGYISELNNLRNRKDMEIEQLKNESLQARYDALISRINPHFFFNSLNGISALVQRGDEEVALNYISHLSDIFRYTLRSDHKQLSTVESEVAFAKAFAEVMEVRFGGKLKFEINVHEAYLHRQLPVMSLLPLLENVAVHNRIDSKHLMTVMIGVENDCIVVSNNIYPKLVPPKSNGTGLCNLNRRYELLMGKKIEFSNDGTHFKVWLPLKN